MKRFWTSDELCTLRRDYADTPTAELARALQREIRHVYAKAADLGLKKSAAYLAGPHASRLRRGDNVGAAFRFAKGHVPANKGKKGICHPGSVATQFKPGELSGRAAQLVQPVGSYRINADGILERKIGTTPGPNNLRWKPVQRLVWEAAHGPIPDGQLVVFKPGMRTTELELITLDRLECISRTENMRRNTYHQYGKEIAQLVQLRGAITRQINKRSRKEGSNE